MPCLFVSYRREDSAGFAGRLTDALEQRFGVGSVFRDVDDIQPGEDFEAVIERRLHDAKAVLVLIGPGWLAASAAGERRLDHPQDFVRREIELALGSGRPVVPILVGGASMPEAAVLPASIRGLSNRHALSLGDASWAADRMRLEAVLAQWVKPADAARSRGAGRLLGAAATTLAAVGLGAWLWGAGAQDEAQAIVGSWHAEVRYPWNLSLEETYDFELRDGRIEGLASFLGMPRVVEAVEWRDGRLHFLTRSEVVAGEAQASELVQHYELTPDGGELQVRLEIQRNGGRDPPLEFVARRR